MFSAGAGDDAGVPVSTLWGWERLGPSRAVCCCPWDTKGWGTQGRVGALVPAVGGSWALPLPASSPGGFAWPLVTWVSKGALGCLR